MQLSQPVDWVDRPFIGYIVNGWFSNENKETLGQLIGDIGETFQDNVFCMPLGSLHITLLDWLAPLENYEGQDKDKLFARIRPDFDKAMSEVFSITKPFTVHFDELKVSPSTIYVVGHDNGEFQKIREGFIKKVDLLPNTKLPPQIIHSSLARFTKPIDLNIAESFIAGKKLDLTQEINGFRLIRTAREPMLQYEIIKKYKLTSKN